MPHVEIPQFEFKLVILGEANCGKTSLITRFTQGYFRQHSSSSHTTHLNHPAPQLNSLYPNFVTKSIPITANNIPTKIQIWDVAGQPSNNKRNNSKNKQQYTAAKAYYSTSSAILLGYDVTSRSSYNEMRVWLEEVRSSLKLTNSGGGEVVVVIVGLKSDLLHNNNNNEGVPEYEVQQLAQALNLLYIPTSSKLDINVTTLFQRVAVEVLERRRRLELGSAYNGHGANNGGGGYHSSLNGVSPVSKRDMYSKFYDGMNGAEGGGGMKEELLNNNSMEHLMSGGNPALDGGTPSSPKDNGKHKKKGKNHRRSRSTTTNHQEDALSTDGGCAGAIMNCGGGMETTTDNEDDERDHSHHGGDITMNSENEEIGFDKVDGEEEDEGKANGSFLKMCGSPTWCGKTSDTID